MRIVLGGCLGALLILGLGCSRQPSEPGTATVTQPPAAEPASQPAVKQPDCAPESEHPKKPVAEGSEWRVEYGPAEAKVLVEAFYPMSPKHGWVGEINQRLVDRFPGQVRVVYINWWSPEGAKAFRERDIGECSTYLVNGQIVVQKSPVKGEWAEKDLVAAVREAVQKAYGDKMREVEPSAPSPLARRGR